MLEDVLLQILIISLYTNVGLTIITFVLIIVLTVILYKENHTSACR